MVKRIVVIFVILVISSTSFSQKVIPKNELTEYHKIYGIALNNFLNFEPSHFVLIDSSDNTAISAINFSGLAKRFHLDSSWTDFLNMVDLKKTTLQKIKLEKIETIHTIRYFNRDTIFKIQRENHDVGSGIVNPYGWIDGVMTVSTPILSGKKDKAVIEISYIRDESDGEGGIVFLEKKNNKWIILKYIRTWVS